MATFGSLSYKRQKQILTQLLTNYTTIIYIMQTTIKYLAIFLCLLIITIPNLFGQNGQIEPVDYVNTLMGTDSKVSLSNGNTYPAVGVPWGMNMWTPQTGKMGDGWQYTYSSDKIRGLKQTHQPSPWMNDYGQFSLMPVSGKSVFDQDERASWFSHKSEIAKPYYYKVYLADYDVTAEVTPTERAAMFRFSFGKTDSAFVVLDAFDRGSEVQIIPEKNMLIGYSTRYSRGKLPNFKNYFVVVFDRPFANKAVWEGKTKKDGVLKINANHVGAIVGFKSKGKHDIIHARVASSFISHEQAILNLNELGQDSFDKVAGKARKLWNENLGKIKVEGGTIDQMRTFYSCLYRTLFFPNKLYEYDAKGNIVHYSPYTGEILPGYMFGGTGFWDTFRALYPLLNMVYPSIDKEMQEGLLNCYKEGGFLPEWSSPGFADIMIGNNSASVVAEAYLKGLRGYDIQTLYEALKHGANNEGPMTAVGRKGVAYYNDLGYVPYDVGINENAARTLEYAYDDFAIYRLAKALGKPKEEIELYAKRSQNYKNLFDPSTNLMRGKNKDGQFQSPFNPLKWGDAFTEGNSWHYSWSVFHDVQGLIDLMGGNKTFVNMLDSVFVQPPLFDDSYYGGVIHEIREMQIADMGQYAHGNQPIQHMIYLYNYAGEPWKAQYWAREVMNRMYSAAPDGYCGDEDNGQTSAWYVFSALGYYPVCPAMDEYVLGAPLFKKATIKLENGKSFVIEAPNNSGENKYVHHGTLGGKIHSLNYITHTDVMKGGTLKLDMRSEPNKSRGTKASSYPYSFTTDKNKF
jgi:predicted alpha-1,2-mannosidase